MNKRTRQERGHFYLTGCLCYSLSCLYSYHIANVSLPSPATACSSKASYFIYAEDVIEVPAGHWELITLIKPATTPYITEPFFLRRVLFVPTGSTN